MALLKTKGEPPITQFRKNPSKNEYNNEMDENDGGDALSIELIEIAEEMTRKNQEEQREKLKQEEEALRKTVEENPLSRRAKLELAKFLFHQNEYIESEELAFGVLQQDDKNANAFCLLGRIYGFGQPQDASKAEEYFKKALNVDNDYAKAHYFYAYLLRSRLNRYDDAEKHYRIAMKLRPEDVTSYNDCAIMLVRQQRIDEAKQLYEKVLELQPEHSIAHFNLANLLRKDLRDYKEAEKHFLISIQKRPKFTAALNNYATMLHHQLKRYSEAEYYYKSALNIDPKYSRAHFNYANLCREHLKKYSLAQEHYLLAIQYDSSNPNFYNNYGLLLQYALREYTKAKLQYETALRLDNNHALGHCNYATILMQMVDTKYNSNFDEITLSFKQNEKKNNTSNKQNDPYFNNSDDDMDDVSYVPKSITNKKSKNNSNSDEKSDENEKSNEIEDFLNFDNIRTQETWKLIYKKTKYKNVKEEYMRKSRYHFKVSVSLNPKLVMAYNNYGCLLRRLGKQDEAKQMFQKALMIDPEFTMAKRNLERSNGTLKTKTINSNGVSKVGQTANLDEYMNNKVNQNQKSKSNDDGCIVM